MTFVLDASVFFAAGEAALAGFGPGDRLLTSPSVLAEVRDAAARCRLAHPAPPARSHGERVRAHTMANNTAAAANVGRTSVRRISSTNGHGGSEASRAMKCYLDFNFTSSVNWTSSFTLSGP